MGFTLGYSHSTLSGLVVCGQNNFFFPWISPSAIYIQPFSGWLFVGANILFHGLHPRLLTFNPFGVGCLWVQIFYSMGCTHGYSHSTLLGLVVCAHNNFFFPWVSPTATYIQPFRGWLFVGTNIFLNGFGQRLFIFNPFRVGKWLAQILYSMGWLTVVKIET
jgi:hypothetical protein